MTTGPIIAWGAATAQARGPVVAGLAAGEQRNAIGVHAGAFSVYQALAVATGDLAPGHRPDLAGTCPPAGFGPFPQWAEPGRIVTLDPWGHRVAQAFAAERAAGMDIRPSIAITGGHLSMPEINAALATGRLHADGKVLSRGGEITVTKIAIEPVWWLPGVADRLGLSEVKLRQTLFEVTDGMYPALVDRPDRKVFLPPIGGTSVYLFGHPRRLGTSATRITCRVHDECSGSDVFGSDLCTCRPYLAFGVEEAIRSAQQGGLGAIVYNRKEGRALGEVVKLLVYNARSQTATGDRPADYFTRTEAVAGACDMRFQALSVDVLHWLGLRRIDRWVSMSHLKSDALTEAGIEIVEQVEIPDSLVPPRADVEMSAKHAAGYFTNALAS
jgi:GTP cyclohydrolase II